MSDNVTENLPDEITVKVDGADRTVFMSFGLLNELTAIAKDPALIGSILLNEEIRTQVLNSLLAGRKKNGKKETEVDYSDLDISIPDVEALLDWASKHVMSFFIRSVQKMGTLMKSHEEVVTNLASFLDGSKGSRSKKPSSGPST